MPRCFIFRSKPVYNIVQKQVCTEKGLCSCSTQNHLSLQTFVIPILFDIDAHCMKSLIKYLFEETFLKKYFYFGTHLLIPLVNVTNPPPFF